MATYITFLEAQHKINLNYAYQESCQKEALTKLRSMLLEPHEIDQLMAHLIEHNFLNEGSLDCIRFYV